jgi:pimeloyl-ACP methyl ester carboxylesterase
MPWCGKNDLMDLLTTSDGVSIAYHTFWPTNLMPGLPPVVLQHGFAADSVANWLRPGVVDALLAAGRHVIAVDARGHGQSDTPHDPAFYGESRMADDLSELFTALELPEVDLVGYSMGAIVSLVLASQDHRVRRLIAGGVGAGVAEMGGVDSRHLELSALAAALRADDIASITDPVARSFRQFAESTGADRFALAAQAESVHQRSIPLERITARSLVLVGDADPLAVRPHVLANAIPGALFCVIPGDHLGAVGAAEFAPTIVQFLGE